MSTAPHTDITTSEIIDQWLVAYTNDDATARRADIEALWNPAGRLLEPPLEAEGHDGIDQLAVAVQTNFSGNHFRRSTVLDEHHATARYGWDMLAPDGSVVLSGEDIVRFDDDGRLLQVVGFFGQPAPLGA